MRRVFPVGRGSLSLQEAQKGAPGKSRKVKRRL